MIDKIKYLTYHIVTSDAKMTTNTDTQTLCPECSQPMEEGYFMKGEAYWAYEKGFLKGMTSREKIKTPRQAQARRCQRCHLILFRY